MASARLKRKLHNDPDSRSHYGHVDECFVEIGTALPSLSSARTDTNEFKPLWEQEVFDDQGRKRLHGAFTGGFSAGYHNTVGSKEGWTPSTFKSSRAKPNESQRKSKSSSSSSSSTGTSLVDAAKRFMDDEDLEELANSRQLETSSSYAAPVPSSSTYDPLLGLFGNSNPSVSTSTSTPTSSSTIPSTLASLLTPSPSRIGAKLMRKMGWRQGQGCGPRLTKKQRKRQALELGLVLEPSFEEEEDDEEGEEGGDEERFGHYYAPLDRPLILLDAVAASEDKGRGLGFDSWSGIGGARRKAVREQRLGAGAGGKGKGSMREEEDPYAQDERGLRGEVVEELMDEEDDDGPTERMGRQRVDAHSSDRPKGKHKDETFHDGVKVLSGFALHHTPYTPPTTSQLPPNPPQEWRPNPTKIWAEEQAEAMRTTSSQQEGKENRAHAQLSADQRGTLLGEKLPPPPPKSVFEYLSSKDKERLSTLSTTGHLPPSSMPTSGTSSNLTPLGANRSRPSASAPSRVPEPDEEFTIPSLDSSTASLALRGFQPFSSASTSPDPIRQARYTLFLQYSAGQLPTSIQGFPFGPRPLPLSTHSSSSTSSNTERLQTMKELNKELRDYVAAAKVFKPVSGMLGNRFTSGTSASALLVPQVEPGLYTPALKTKEDHMLEEEEKKKGLGVVELTPVQQAIKNDQFGPLTRTTTTFRPDKLLCKRFGVADPFAVKKGEVEEEGGQRVGGKWKEANLEGEFKVPLERSGAGRKVGDVLGKASMDELMREANGGMIPAHTPMTTKDPAEGLVDHLALATSTPLTARAPLPTLETVGLGDDERQGEETLTYEKAPRDIFETIFGESDGEESEEEEEEDEGFPLEGRREVESDAGAQPMAVEVPMEVEVARPTLGPTMAPSGPTLAETTTLLSSETVVDYKPTFVNRSSKKLAGSDKDKKKKKEKEKRKVGTLSFDMGDEEEGSANVGKVVKKVKKERDTKREGKKVEIQVASKHADAVDEAEEWEEAPSIVHPSILASSSSSSSSSAGRKREEEKNESAIGARAKISFEPVKRARAADLF